MKHIIVEGPDRVGKNTLIEFLCSKSDNYIVRHFKKPIGNTNEEKIKYQEDDFLYEFRFSSLAHRGHTLEREPTDLFIWNRSHIGEWVYGDMYRNYKPNWIWEYEKLFNYDKKNIYLILLYADPKFLIDREDGKSLSGKLEDREQEIKLFHEAIELSTIKNKLSICANNGDKFVPVSDIKNQVTNFLNF
jgi:thymidylate kinase